MRQEADNNINMYTLVLLVKEVSILKDELLLELQTFSSFSIEDVAA